MPEEEEAVAIDPQPWDAGPIDPLGNADQIWQRIEQRVNELNVNIPPPIDFAVYKTVYVKGDMKAIPELELLDKELRNGVYNNDTLRAAIKVAGAGYALDHVHMLSPRVNITTCQDCRQYSFSIAMHSTYGGLRYVCSSCSHMYVECRSCSSLILCADNQLHFHAGRLAELSRENQVAAFDADIMNRGSAEYRQVSNRRPRQDKGVPAAPPIRYFGIELEMERRRDVPVPPDMILKAKYSLAKGLIMVKHDGSLSAAPNRPGQRGSNGFEIVTLPCTMEYHRGPAGWHQFFEIMGPWMEAKPETAGLHIHVSANSMTHATIGKIIRFINDKHNLDFMRMIADRDFLAANPNGRVYANTWPDEVERKVTELVSRRTHSKGCKNSPIERVVRGYYLNDKKLVTFDQYGHPILLRHSCGSNTNVVCKCPSGRYDYAGHYAAFNIRTNRPTIEFRMFQGGTNEAHFWAALEFCDALIGFCEATSFEYLMWEGFVNWMKQSRHLYKDLARWLVVSGHLEPLKKKES